MKYLSMLIIIPIAVAFTSCDGTALKSDKEKYSYAIGFQFAKGLKRDNIDIDMNSFKAAMTDVFDGRDARMSESDMQSAIQTISMNLQRKKLEKSAENLKKQKVFLDENMKKKDVKVTKSGLQYRIIEKGSGRHPKETDTVTVHYRGSLTNGTEFDSSYARNKPARFKLNQVIKGWTEGLKLMRTGSKYELVIPPDLGYGPRGNGSIPGNSVLIFEVELIGIGD
jgi:FKBP-type peptidyl-prolyl cis-trans isomerase